MRWWEGSFSAPRSSAGSRREWQPRTFRLWVAGWNERALRAYRRAGFHEVRRGEESRFVEMERSA